MGTAICGRIRGKGVSSLEKVGYIEAGIEEVGWFSKGHRVGAGKGVTIKKPTRIAVVSVGYYHGFGVQRDDEGDGLITSIINAMKNRRGKKFVRINGQWARIVGHVGMMYTIIDVTNVNCGVGDTVTMEVDPVDVKGLPRVYR